MGAVASRTASSAASTVAVEPTRGVVGAHEPAGGLGGVAEQVADLALLGLGHELEQREPAVLVHLADEVRRVVGRHPREQPCGVVVGALVDELELVLGVELLEDVGLELAVEPHGLDDLLALLVARGLDEVGDLGGVQLRQPAVRDAEPRRRARGSRRARSGRSRRWLVVETLLPSRPPRSRRSSGRRPGSTPTTSQVPSTLASSISLAVIRRPRTKLMRWRASRSLDSSSSPGRRSKRRRSTRRPSKVARPRSSEAILRIGTNRSRPSMRTTTPTTGGCEEPPSRATTSWMRPIRSPSRSTSGRWMTEERWRSSSAMVSVGSGPSRAEARLPRRAPVERLRAPASARSAASSCVVVDVGVRDEPRARGGQRCRRARRAPPAARRAPRRRDARSHDVGAARATGRSRARRSSATTSARRRARAWSSASRSTIVRMRDEAGRGEHAGLAHRAAEPLALDAALARSRRRARRAASRPARRDPWRDSSSRSSPARRADAASAAERDDALKSRAPSRCTGRPPRGGDQRRGRRRGRAGCRPRPCGCSR